MVSMELSTQIILGVVGGVVVSILLLFFVYVFYILYVRKIKYGHLPSPPYVSFFRGHLASISPEDHEAKTRLFMKWVEDNDGLVCLFVMHKVVILTADLKIVKELLFNTDYPKLPFAYRGVDYLFGKRNAGSGLVTNFNHERWKQRRALLQTANREEFIEDHISKFNRIGDAMVQVLNKKARGKTAVSILEIMERTTLDAIMKVGFDSDISALKDKDNELYVGVSNVLEAVPYSFASPLMHLNPCKQKEVNGAIEGIRCMRDTATRLIEERREKIDSGDIIPYDIMSAIVEMTEGDSDNTLVDQQDEFVTSLSANQTTTPYQLSFVLYYLGSRPEMLSRLTEEVNEVVGDKKDITLADIGKLNYMRQVWNEVARLQPSGHTTGRLVPEKSKFGKFEIPANTGVLINFAVLHRRECYFDDPKEFNPDRFAGEVSDAFMPHSAGHRSCYGERFVKALYPVILCKFIQNFEYELVPNQSDKVIQTIGLKPAGGVMATITQKSDSGEGRKVAWSET